MQNKTYPTKTADVSKSACKQIFCWRLLTCYQQLVSHKAPTFLPLYLYCKEKIAAWNELFLALCNLKCLQWNSIFTSRWLHLSYDFHVRLNIETGSSSPAGCQDRVSSRVMHLFVAWVILHKRMVLLRLFLTVLVTCFTLSGTITTTAAAGCTGNTKISQQNQHACFLSCATSIPWWTFYLFSSIEKT